MRLRNVRSQFLETIERLNERAFMRVRGLGLQVEAKGMLGVIAAVVLLALLIRG